MIKIEAFNGCVQDILRQCLEKKPLVLTEDMISDQQFYGLIVAMADGAKSSLGISLPAYVNLPFYFEGDETTVANAPICPEYRRFILTTAVNSVVGIAAQRDAHLRAIRRHQ
jgi:hypothetical protein